MKHQLRVMDGTGDTKLIWEEDNEVEVDAARELFNKLRGKGYNAYAVKENGKKGELINKFEPAAEKIILAPPMSGG